MQWQYIIFSTMLNKLRKLAKSIEQQNLFLASKDIPSIKLFKNTRELNKLQQAYLSYLYLYHQIYLDIDLKQVSDKVLENEIYEDSYLFWKKTKKTKDKSLNYKNKNMHKKSDIHLIISKDFKEKGSNGRQ